MIIQIALLSRCEISNVHFVVQFDAHFWNNKFISNWRHNDIAIIFKRNQSPIKEQIHIRTQQQTVFSIQAFFITCMSPRLNMTSNQIFRVSNVGNTARTLNLS